MKNDFVKKLCIAGITFFSTLGVSTLEAAVVPSSTYVSKTTVSVSIAPRDNLIIATTVTNWDTRASDVLAVDWIAPKGSFCKSSQFVLSRGMNTTNDVSWAYRTVIHQLASGATIVCSGDWVVNVVNVKTHHVLASAGYTVAADSDLSGSADSADSSSSPSSLPTNS